jgi:ABC-type sugar transport system ATPase subunit
MNLLPGIVWDDGDESAISVARTELRSYDRRLRPYAGDRVLVGIRPEHLRLAAPGDDEAFTATVRHRGFTGPTVHLHLEVAGQHEVVAVVAPPGPDRGTAVGLTAQRLHLFDTAGWAIAHDVR